MWQGATQQLVGIIRGHFESQIINNKKKDQKKGKKIIYNQIKQN